MVGHFPRRNAAFTGYGSRPVTRYFVSWASRPCVRCCLPGRVTCWSFSAVVLVVNLRHALVIAPARPHSENEVNRPYELSAAVKLGAAVELRRSVLPRFGGRALQGAHVVPVIVLPRRRSRFRIRRLTADAGRSTAAARLNSGAQESETSWNCAGILAARMFGCAPSCCHAGRPAQAYDLGARAAVAARRRRLRSIRPSPPENPGCPCPPPALSIPGYFRRGSD